MSLTASRQDSRAENTRNGTTPKTLITENGKVEIDARLVNLQRYGRSRAEALGIGPEEVEGLVDDLRAARG